MTQENRSGKNGRDLPELYRTDRPTIPQDLSSCPDIQLWEWKAQLSRVQLSVQNQMSAANANIRSKGKLPRLEYNELLDWQKRAKYAVASIQSEIIRVKEEMGKRSIQPRKGKSFRATLLDLCAALREDDYVSGSTRDAAADMASLLEREMAEKGDVR